MEKRIVLTGGPGSGKTSVLTNMVKVFSNQGIKVIVVPETATEIINAGIKCFGDDAIDLVDFQELIMRLQLNKEDVYNKAIEMYKNKYPDKDILIIYDRGAIDNKAYMNDDEFLEVLNRLNNVQSYSDLLNRYDLVIDLVGAKEFYTTLNNKARSEDVDTALNLGKSTLKSWIGHKKIKIVMPKEKIDDKVNEVINYVNEILVKKQIKRQKKYLVDLIKTDFNKILYMGNKSHIEQSYLMSSEDQEKRIRKITTGGSVVYELTVFKVNNGVKELVSSKNISEKIYSELLEFKKSGSSTIIKDRLYFEYNGQYMYLDVFDGEEIGYLEINISEDENVIIPAFVSVIEDVSDKQEYSNMNKSKNNGSKLMKKND